MNILLIFYRLLLIVLLPIALPILYFILKRKSDHAHFAERVGLVYLKNAPCTNSIWFHAASVGEVRSIKHIVDEIRKTFPDYKIIISTFTITGRAEAKDYVKADEAFLIPLENNFALSYIMRLMGTKAFVVVDTEIWPNMIYTASKHAPLIMINARISDKTMKSYKKLSFLFGDTLKQFDKILTKSKLDMDRFVDVIGNDKNVSFAGNIKFQSRKNIAEMQKIDGLSDKNYFFIASTHENEEKILLKAYNNVKNEYDCLVIAPRHIKRTNDIVELASNMGYKTSLFSENDFGGEVIIVDAFGQLEKLYAYANNIFIGGSLSNIGGHNIYEALQFKKHVYIGENMQNFQDVYDIAIKYDVVTKVKSDSELESMFKQRKDGDFDSFFADIDSSIANASNIAIETITTMIKSKEGK